MESNSIYQARWMFAPVIALPGLFFVIGALLS